MKFVNSLHERLQPGSPGGGGGGGGGGEALRYLGGYIRSLSTF